MGRACLSILCLLPGLISGCAITTVRPNPGPHDKGIRYWRPKPYLLVQPATAAEKEPSDRFVALSIEWLPDFSEEYSIHIRAGLGSNNTAVTLDKGWNLTNINVNIDSQTDEIIGALGDFVGAIPKNQYRNGQSPTMIVKATNVPMGFYEGVISPDPNGRRLSQAACNASAVSRRQRRSTDSLSPMGS